MCGGGLYAVKQWAARSGEAVMAPARLESRAPLTRSGIVGEFFLRVFGHSKVLLLSCSFYYSIRPFRNLLQTQEARDLGTFPTKSCRTARFAMALPWTGHETPMARGLIFSKLMTFVPIIFHACFKKPKSLGLFATEAPSWCF